MVEDEALDLIERIAGLPKGARITSACLTYDYLDPDGNDCYGMDYLGSSPATNRIGLLRLAEAKLVQRQLRDDEELP